MYWGWRRGYTYLGADKKGLLEAWYHPEQGWPGPASIVRIRKSESQWEAACPVYWTQFAAAVTPPGSLLRDRMSSCDPTYLGIKATGQAGGGVEGCRGRGKSGGEVPREGGSGVQQFQGREWFRSQGGGLRKERCLLGWGGVGTEEGPGSPRLGHTVPAPTFFVCTPIAQGQHPPGSMAVPSVPRWHPEPRAVLGTGGSWSS